MSETPRTNFVAHESGDAEWNRSMNRFGRMKAHAEIIERELAAAQAQLAAERKELEEAEVLGKYYGVAGRRWWWSGGAWLYPGQKVVVIDAAKGTGK